MTDRGLSDLPALERLGEDVAAAAHRAAAADGAGRRGRRSPHVRRQAPRRDRPGAQGRQYAGPRGRLAARVAQYAARRRDLGRSWRRLSPRVAALAGLVVLSAAAASASATLLALRGAVIPVPRATPPEQTPAPGTAGSRDSASRTRGRASRAGRCGWRRAGRACCARRSASSSAASSGSSGSTGASGGCRPRRPTRAASSEPARRRSPGRGSSTRRARPTCGRSSPASPATGCAR